MNVAIAGCGALGSWTAWMLAGSPEIQVMVLIDGDRIEEHNLATTVYMEHQIGHGKALALAEMLYRKGHGDTIPVFARIEMYPQISVSLPGREPYLIVDTFDNVPSRKCTGTPGWTDTVHVAVSEQRTGSVIWHQHWRPPRQTRGENPVCTHHLGAQIIQLTAAHAARVIRRFLQTGERMDVPIILESGVIVDV